MKYKLNNNLSMQPLRMHQWDFKIVQGETYVQCSSVCVIWWKEKLFFSCARTMSFLLSQVYFFCPLTALLGATCKEMRKLDVEFGNNHRHQVVFCAVFPLPCTYYIFVAPPTNTTFSTCKWPIPLKESKSEQIHLVCFTSILLSGFI